VQVKKQQHTEQTITELVHQSHGTTSKAVDRSRNRHFPKAECATTEAAAPATARPHLHSLSETAEEPPQASNLWPVTPSITTTTTLFRRSVHNDNNNLIRNHKSGPNLGIYERVMKPGGTGAQSRRSGPERPPGKKRPCSVAHSRTALPPLMILILSNSEGIRVQIQMKKNEDSSLAN